MINKRNKIKSLDKSRYYSLNKYDRKIYDEGCHISRIKCYECGRLKHRFETEKEALLFLYYNSEIIESQSGVKPCRSYWCNSCKGYHVTHLKINEEN